MPSRSGFTLLEVVIALGLLSFLSYFTAQAIQKAVQAKTKIQDQIDRESELREAMELMVRDIRMAFNYRDVNIELYNKALDQTQQPGPSPTPGGPPTPTPVPTPPGSPTSADTLQKKEDKVVTQFVGETDSLNFSSLSYIRTTPDEMASDQAEIGYSLDRCRSRRDPSKSYSCLWRRVSPFIDEDIDEGGERNVILENVERLTLRYMGPGFTEEWVRSWSSDGSSSESMKGNFPYAVEINLEVLDDRFDPPKKIGMTSVAQLRFPNNPKPTEPPSENLGR